MKKIVCLLICVCLLLCMAACRGDDRPQETESAGPTESQTSTENQNSTEGQDPTQSTENKQEDPVKPKILSLEKALHTYFEWADDFDPALVRSAHSCITLGQADAAAYPELAKTLTQIATMQENAMLDEFSNLVSFAKDELAANRSGFETYVSTLDVQVRRADQVILSLLSDSYSHYGQIEHLRVFHGSNYDPATGKELALNDVVKNVNNDLALAVQEALTSYTLTGDFYSKDTVENYFANTPYDGFNWTVDYAGLTFYFAPGELNDEGSMTATVSFAKHPELFQEKYLTVPAEYSVELPKDISFFTQLDGDDAFEVISVSGYYDDARNAYIKYGIYTDTDGQFYEEDHYAYDYHPYYLKTESGNFLYLFCESFDEGVRQMELIVFRLNQDGSITKIGEKNVSPAWLADNKFLVPTDPGSLILDDPDQNAQTAAFKVGKDGMPAK